MVGAGQVGQRKIGTLLDCGARNVLVLDTDPEPPGLAELVSRHEMTFACRPFVPEDLNGRFLVIACTNNEDVNWQISRLCKEKNILCNIVDQPEKCSFILPALHLQGDLTVAVSTAGKSPALSKKIRKDLCRHFGPEYGILVELMGRLRALILSQNLPTEANTRIFSALVASNILEAIEHGDHDEVMHLLKAHVPSAVHPQLEDLCHACLERI